MSTMNLPKLRLASVAALVTATLTGLVMPAAALGGLVSDTNPPTVSDVRVSLTDGGWLGSASVTLSWNGSDDVTGLGSLVFQSQLSRKKGSNWGPWKRLQTHDGVTAFSTRLALWRTFKYRMRARDEAGNWSNWVESKALTLIRRRENQLNLQGSWTFVSQAGATRQQVARTSTAGDTATLTFFGRGATFVLPVHEGQGFVEICIDPDTLDESCKFLTVAGQTDPSPKRFISSFYFLPPAPHVLRLKLLSGAIDVDGAVYMDSPEEPTPF